MVFFGIKNFVSYVEFHALKTTTLGLDYNVQINQ